MKYLVDTHWIISFLNGRPDAVELIAKLTEDGIVMSVITYGEIVEGLVGTNAVHARLAQLEAFASQVDVIAPDLEIARRYGRIRNHLRTTGQMIPDNDVWVAATAQEHGLVVVTRDAHFQRIPDLQARAGG